MIRKAVLFSILLIALFCSSGYPAGFLVYNQDAASSGMANAFTAIADNASAVFYNPAGINQLEGTQLRSGFMLYYPNASFRGAESGERTDMHDDISALLSGYLTHKINDKISIGGGVFSPFGLVTDWPSRWEGDYVSTYAQMRTVFVNPVISIQVHPRLSLAAGINYVYADFKIRRGIDPYRMMGLPFGTTLGQITLDGSDNCSWGYNLGILFHINDQWSLGVSYRSKVNLNMDGRANYRLPRFLQRLFPATDISPRMELPPILSVDIATHLWDKWTFGAGVLWTGWSVFDELAPNFENDLLIPPSMKSVPQDWRDVFAFRLGAQYQFNPTWVFRGGYIYDQTPVPERTLSPMVPDSDANLLSLGIGYTKNNFVIDTSCMAVFFSDRHTRRNVDGLNGKYTATTITFLMSFTYSF